MCCLFLSWIFFPRTREPLGLRVWTQTDSDPSCPGPPGLLNGVDRFLPQSPSCTCLRASCWSFLWGTLAQTASHLQDEIPEGW